MVSNGFSGSSCRRCFCNNDKSVARQGGLDGGAEEAYQRWGEQVDKKLAEDSRSDRKRNLQIDQVA